jgi:hypothetical protein
VVIPAERLVTAPTASGQIAEIILVPMALDASGVASAPRARRLKLPLAATEVAAGSLSTASLRLEIAPSTVRVAVAVRDLHSGVESTAGVAIADEPGP